VQRCPVYPLFTTPPFLTPVLDYVVGTLAVFKLPPLKDGISIRLLRINLVVFPPSFSYAFVSRLVASALARVEPLSTLCPVSLSLISYQSLFLTASYLGRQTNLAAASLATLASFVQCSDIVRMNRILQAKARKQRPSPTKWAQGDEERMQGIQPG